jgi:hypothetical protein
MPSIDLHPKLGLNPRLTYCPNCHGEGRGIVLLGNKNFRGECSEHGTMWAIGPRTKKCLVKGCGRTLTEHRELEEGERVADHSLCEGCEAASEAVRKELEAGGLPTRCRRCGTEGVMRITPETREVIEKIRAEGYGGVVVEDCPLCQEKEVTH